MAQLLKLLGALIFALLAYLLYSYRRPSPIVATTYGQVQGIRSMSRDGRPYFEFLGIPYAKPPIGQLRYKAPQPPDSWSGIRSVNHLGAECAQYNPLYRKIMGAEDCLVLNVFTPKSLENFKNLEMALAPVMVFIHGGAFVFGSADVYRPDYFMDEDIVLVTLNYRLASLGFLNTEDGVVRGNMGLRDQTLALKWVRDNIKNFSGNPEQVTLFGESAGGASVHLQIMSKQAKGLFHRGISQSGSALSPFNFKPHPADQARRYAAKLNCANANTKEMVQCLRKLPIESLMKAHEDTAKLLRDQNSFFGPSIESPTDGVGDTFISELPRVLTSAGGSSGIPFMTGYNSHEGIFLSSDLIRDSENLQLFNEQFNQVIPGHIHYPQLKPATQLDQEMTEIRKFYFGGQNQGSVENFTNLYTDWLWAISSQETAKMQAQHTPTYLYYYSYKGEFQLADVTVALEGKWAAMVEVLIHRFKKAVRKHIFQQEPIHYGAGHVDELALLFKLTRMSDIGVNDKDYQMSKDMVKLWVDFGKNEKILKFKNQLWSPLNKNEPLKLFEISDNSGYIDDPNHLRTQFLAKFHP